jgi:hypothetical protein
MNENRHGLITSFTPQIVSIRFTAESNAEIMPYMRKKAHNESEDKRNKK